MKLPYDRTLQPPAPVVTVEVFDRMDMTLRERILAKLDTAADISAVPLFVITKWQLKPEREIVLSGYEATPTTVRSYIVGIDLPNARVRRIEVIPISEDYALLGRDVLNNLDICLNGPELTLELRSP